MTLYHCAMCTTEGLRDHHYCRTTLSLLTRTLSQFARAHRGAMRKLRQAATRDMHCYYRYVVLLSIKQVCARPDERCTFAVFMRNLRETTSDVEHAVSITRHRRFWRLRARKIHHMRTTPIHPIQPARNSNTERHCGETGCPFQL